MCRIYEIDEMRLAWEVVVFKAELRVCGGHDVIITTFVCVKSSLIKRERKDYLKGVLLSSYVTARDT